MLLLCNQNKKTVVFLFSFEAISSFLRSKEIMKPSKKRGEKRASVGEEEAVRHKNKVKFL